MKITNVKKVVEPSTYEVRYYFSGYITPEYLQDCRNGGYGMSYETLGEDFDLELRDAFFTRKKPWWRFW